MEVENCLAVCHNPVLEHDQSNRININQCECRALETVEVDFSKCLTTDEIKLTLRSLESLNLHIVGSRGYVYHSGKLAQMVELIDTGAYFNYSLFPRTFGLRAKVKEVDVHEFT